MNSFVNVVSETVRLSVLMQTAKAASINCWKGYSANVLTVPVWKLLVGHISKRTFFSFKSAKYSGVSFKAIPWPIRVAPKVTASATFLPQPHSPAWSVNGIDNWLAKTNTSSNVYGGKSTSLPAKSKPTTPVSLKSCAKWTIFSMACCWSCRMPHNSALLFTPKSSSPCFKPVKTAVTISGNRKPFSVCWEGAKRTSM